MTIFLDGVAARFYRGIGPEAQFIAPFARMNFFIGANNSGKSIVLNLLASRVADTVMCINRVPNDPTEQYRGAKTGELLVAIGRDTNTVVDTILQAYKDQIIQAQAIALTPLANQIREICEKLMIEGCIWVKPTSNHGFELIPDSKIREVETLPLDWRAIWISMTGLNGGSAREHWIPQTIEKITKCVAPALPPIYLIPAKRILGSKGETLEDLSGRGLIDHLATLQNPAWDKQENREKFENINRFLQEVTGKTKATLEVPSEREHLLVHMDNKVLPLSSLGTGIHEVVLIAAFCTIHDGSIMCIEEPEIHLHPLLQRKLTKYLIQNTKSQYFIATHSSAVIDTPGSNVFHVTNDGVQTRIKAALTKVGQREILDDLGYRASDILQANAVIWVEGPSDRIYLNHWIGATDHRIHEGIHYSIMFYGGGLIRHLTASDDALDDFIKLRDLNRNMAIVLDSDKDAASTPLKHHAQRLVEEMNESTGIVWVTAGREVENYIDGA